MSSQTVIRLKDENSFNHVYESLGFRLPKSEKITLYMNRPHLISCSIDPKDMRIDVKRWGEYLSQPIHSSDLSGMPRDVGTIARRLVKDEPPLEERFLDEVKTVISFDHAYATYSWRAFGAASYKPGTLQIVGNHLLATSLSINDIIDQGPNICGFNFLSDVDETNDFSVFRRQEKLSELPDNVKNIAEELIEAAKRNR